jgi:hypothetical protein
VPTSRHAEILFGLLVDLLGDQGVVSTANDGTLRKLYRRDAVDPRWIVPWPVAQLSMRGRIGLVSAAFDVETGEEVAEPKLPAGKASKLRGLTPGQIDLFDGAASISVVYGDDGRFRETSLNDLTQCRLAEIAEAVASKRGPAAELIASCVAMLDPGRHGPGRVRMPVPMPGGPERVWIAGLLAARRALYAGTVPADARYVVADGVAGSAVASGATLEAATSAFFAAVAKAPPAPSEERHTAWDDYDDDGNLLQRGRPLRPGEPPPWEESAPLAKSWEAEDPSERAILAFSGEMRGPKADDPMPEVTAATVPYAVIPLAGSPTVPPPLGRWERTISAKGATAHVARLVGPEGFLQVGERVLWRADPRTLDDLLDSVDVLGGVGLAARSAASPFARFVRFRASTYRWADARDGVPAHFEPAGGASGPRFDGADLDGDLEASLVRRHVKVRRGTE